MSNTARIRELNDAFRTTFMGGKLLLTPGVNELAETDRTAVLTKIQGFREFDPGNDPYDEHDFVSVEHVGVTYFGKIDYYAPDMEHASEDPSDTTRTIRVLTIMRADEY